MIVGKQNVDEEEIQAEDEKGESSSEHCCFRTSACTSPMACQEKEEVMAKSLVEEKTGSKNIQQLARGTCS